MKSLKKKIALVSFVSLFVLVTSGIFPNSPSLAQSSATVTASPRSSTVGVNDSVTVDVTISGADNVVSYDFILSYNPQVLTIVNPDTDVANGTFLRSPASIAARNVDNSAGTAKLAFYSTGGGASNTGTLGTVTFKAVATGTSNLNLTRVLLGQANDDGPGQASTKVNGSVTVSPQPSIPPSKAALIIKARYENYRSITQFPVRDQNVVVTLVPLNSDESIQKTVRMQYVQGLLNGQTSYFVTNQAENPFQLNNLDIGTYDVYVKGPVHLTHKASITLVNGWNTLEIGNPGKPLFPGDISTASANKIDLDDYSIMVESYGCVRNQPAPEGKVCGSLIADLNFNNTVDPFDFTFLAANFGGQGD